MTDALLKKDMHRTDNSSSSQPAGETSQRGVVPDDVEWPMPLHHWEANLEAMEILRRKERNSDSPPSLKVLPGRIGGLP
jgi:hypothetical protein